MDFRELKFCLGERLGYDYSLAKNIAFVIRHNQESMNESIANELGKKFTKEALVGEKEIANAIMSCVSTANNPVHH